MTRVLSLVVGSSTVDPSQPTGGAWWRSRTRHDETMSASEAGKYRNFQVIRGGGSHPTRIIRGRRKGRRVKSAAELYLEREIRAAFARLEDADGNVPSEAIQKIREGVQLPLGCFGRRIVEAHAAGCSHADVRNIADRIIEWIDQLYEKTDDTVKERVFYQRIA